MGSFCGNDLDISVLEKVLCYPGKGVIDSQTVAEEIISPIQSWKHFSSIKVPFVKLQHTRKRDSW